MKEQLVNLPADQRADATAEMNKALEDMKAVKNATEARKKYGDACGRLCAQK
ncbi:MAG: hypothetical protein JW841_15430 [Deltaproteobacteria bacterium]|nr:hypothetical protein [Deltaproteobacteria bacterium]